MLPDRQYRWLVVAYSLLIQAVSVGILIYCFALFTLPWLDEFGASRRDVMITISCLQIGMGVLSPILGRVMDHYPMRNIVLLGVVMLAIGLWLTHHAQALWQIWLIYATCMPVATAMMGTLASQTLVAKWFYERRGLALGISAMGTNVGGIIFPLVVAGLLIEVGWRDTFAKLALASLILVVPLTLWVLRRQPPKIVIDMAGATISANDRIWTTREILTTRLFWLPFLCLVPLNMTFGALQFNLGVFARDLGLDDQAAAIFITVSAIGMVLGKLFCGALGDRIDHRVLFWIANTVMLMALGLMFAAQDYASMILAVLFMGLAGGGILPMMGVIFGARFGAASFGRVMGFVMVNVMFGALAPVVAGWIYDVTGNYDLALFGLAALVLPAMAAMFFLPDPDARSKPVTA